MQTYAAVVTSGWVSLFHGLCRMGAYDVIDSLKPISRIVEL